MYLSLSVCLYLIHCYHLSLLCVSSSSQTSHVSPDPHMRNIFIYFEGTYYFLQSLFQKAGHFWLLEASQRGLLVCGDFKPCLTYAGVYVLTSAPG